MLEKRRRSGVAVQLLSLMVSTTQEMADAYKVVGHNLTKEAEISLTCCRYGQ